MAMMISWVMPVNPSHPYLENDPAPSFAPTICASHLGFSLVPHDLFGDLNHLESLSISNAHVEGYQPLNEPLALATGSPLADHLTPPKSIPEGWRHSKQYRDLETWTNWTNWTNGNDLTFSR